MVASFFSGSPVAFSGSRVPSPSLSAAVAPVVAAAVAGGGPLSVGCAAGADQAVVVSALRAGAAGRLSVFGAFGPGVGPAAVAAAAGGASVSWFAGGAAPPVRVRLARRSLACVWSVAPSGSLVAFASAPPPSPFGRGPFPSCGSGTWATVGAASLLGLPVLLVPFGGWVPSPPPALPVAPGGLGAWSVGPFAGSWVWSPAGPVQPSLFG